MAVRSAHHLRNQTCGRREAGQIASQVVGRGRRGSTGCLRSREPLRFLRVANHEPDHPELPDARPLGMPEYRIDTSRDPSDPATECQRGRGARASPARTQQGREARASDRPAVRQQRGLWGRAGVRGSRMRAWTGSLRRRRTDVHARSRHLLWLRRQAVPELGLVSGCPLRLSRGLCSRARRWRGVHRQPAVPLGPVRG